MTEIIPWVHVEGQKKHTQDGCHLVRLMKRVKPHKKVKAIDVGCGDGIIAVEILRLERAQKVVAIDILKTVTDAALKNIESLNLSAAIDVEKISASRFFKRRSQWDSFDRFVINPPFFIQGSGLKNKSTDDQTARHEGSLSLKVWARGAERLLRTGGELFCVFPTERLGELLKELSLKRVEPKELWWLYDDLRKRRVFLRAVRGAKPGLKVHFDFHLSD